MLKYLVILLADNSFSFCNYEDSGNQSIISLDNLRAAIYYAMTENLEIQFVYPEERVSLEHTKLIESVDHVKIMPLSISGVNDIGISNSWDILKNGIECKTIIVRTTFSDLLNSIEILALAFEKYSRINIVIKDVDSITNEDIDTYSTFLKELSGIICDKIIQGCEGQLSILTDRLSLNAMRNCNAGVESITVAPNGLFYICPAFYYGKEEPVGTVSDGLSIPNQQLYKLENAPICRACDAWHCHRCVWLNKIKTLEVNTPGHIQCVLSHLERNAARSMTEIFENKNFKNQYSEIPQIQYLDPFDTLL